MALPKIVTIREQIPSGVFLGLSDLRTPLWNKAENVVFTSLGVSKMKGWDSPATALDIAPIRGMNQNIFNGTQYLYYGNQSTLYRWNVGSHGIVGTGYTGIELETITQPVSIWSIENYGSFVLATNGKDKPQISSALADFVPLIADFTTASFFMKQGPHMIAFNTSINDRGFVWCTADDPLTWTPTQANTAGDLIIRELDTAIVAAAYLGDSIAVYGKDQMFIIGYTGAPFIFGYKHALEGFGAVSKKSVVSIGRRNFGLGKQGFWMTDGASVQYIDDPAIREFVQKNMNWTQVSKVNSYHDEENNRVVWFYPDRTSGEVNKGLAYDYQKKVWSQLDHGWTACLDRQVFSYPVAGGKDGGFFYLNFGDNAASSPLTASLRTKAVEMDEVEMVKAITRLRIECIGNGLEFRLGSQMNLGETVDWLPWLAVPYRNAKADLRKTARFFTLEFRSLGMNEAWELFAIEAYGRARGLR